MASSLDDLDRRIRAMRVRRYTLEEIAADTGMSPQAVASRIKTIWRVIERDGQEPQPGDPTPQEIAERSAEVRQRWTPHDWRVRSGASETPPEPQSVSWMGTWHD